MSTSESRNNGGTHIVRTGSILVGYVHVGGCEHEACLRAMRDGRTYHAIPKVGTLPDYHFATLDEAVAALDAAASDWAPFEALRAAMKSAVDAYIDNLLDDAREGGVSGEYLPTLTDALEDMAETHDAE